MDAIKPYKKGMEYSYTMGAFPTYELIKTRPDLVLHVFVHSSFDKDELEKECHRHNLPMTVNDKMIQKLGNKENIYVIGVFKRFDCELDKSRSHLMLVNPGNMGNLGTILRTAVGFGIKDIAIINPGSDIFNPKVVRSSMGALFRLRFQYFDSFEEYRSIYTKQELFPFMLNATRQLTADQCPKPELFTLIFGNEATGLDDSFLTIGTSVIIPQTEEVDSLNLTIAVGIGLYLFTR